MKSSSVYLFCFCITMTSLFFPEVSVAQQDVKNSTDTNNECVILVHGLNRTSNSFSLMEKSLVAAGYRVINVDYPSRELSIEILATSYITKALDECVLYKPVKIHFVTHSMGAILVRYFRVSHTLNVPGNTIMLGPPNRGSEIVNKLGKFPGFLLINGQAGQQLGTFNDSLPNSLGPVNYPVGVIAGNRSINPVLSLIIPGTDDGKVAVDRAKVEGMTDFLVVPHTHTFIMSRENVIRQTLHFLQYGRFKHSQDTTLDRYEF